MSLVIFTEGGGVSERGERGELSLQIEIGSIAPSRCTESADIRQQTTESRHQTIYIEK
jgi:hypothetical protein